MKSAYPGLSRHGSAPNDPIEQARRFSGDARDIAREIRRQLPEYDADTEEVTQTGQQPAQQQHIHVHVNQASSPEIEVDTELSIGPLKAKGLPKWVTGAIIGVGIVAAVATAIASHFASK